MKGSDVWNRRLNLQGPLLPGYYEDWVQTERQRLDDAYVSTLKKLVQLCQETGDFDKGISYARIAVAKEALDENLHLALMRFYLETGRPGSAVGQFRDLEQLLQTELRARPGTEAMSLVELAKSQAGANSNTTTTQSGLGLPGSALTDSAGTDSAGTDSAGASPSSSGSHPSGKRGSEAGRVHLPVQLTRFFGRIQEIDHALHLFLSDSARLVSLLGPAGVGKTRLSQEIAKRLSEQHHWKVWFVPLADLNSGEGILGLIADTVRNGHDSQLSPIQQVQRQIRGETNLIVLDNLEHLIEPAAAVVSELLDQVSGLSLLVTTRQSLKIEGDHELPVQPLPPPEGGGELLAAAGSDEVAAVAAFSSVQLYINRCQAIHPDYQLTPLNVRTIASICAKLEGLPLALEIAAGLSNAFTPRQLLKSLEDRFELLQTRRRGTVARHSSLRTAIRYSYELLSPDLQRLFSALSVFRGGFTLSAADDVCMEWLAPCSETSAGRRRRRETCMRYLLDLQERSLLQADTIEDAPEARFKLLESFREYGRERLTQAEEEALQDRHAQYFCDQVQCAGASRYRQGKSVQSLLRFDRENLIAAIETYLDRGRIEDAVALLDVSNFQRMGGRMKEVANLMIRKANSHPNLESTSADARITLLRLNANIGLYSGDYHAARDCCNKAMEIARSTGSEGLVATCFSSLAVVASYMNDVDLALDFENKALEHAEPAGDWLLCERALIDIGTIHWTKGDLQEAESAFLRARDLRVAEESGDTWSPWLIPYNLARVLLDQGKLDQAMPLAAEAMRRAKRLMHEFGISMSLSMMSRYYWLKGNYEEALATSYQALLKRQNAGFSFWMFNALQFHGIVLAEIGQFGPATTLLAASQEATNKGRVLDDRDYANALTKVKGGLTVREFDLCWARGLSMEAEEAFDFAVQYR